MWGIAVQQHHIYLGAHITWSISHERGVSWGWTLGKLSFHREEAHETFTVSFLTLDGTAFV